jgi:hypothetical protein
MILRYERWDLASANQIAAIHAKDKAISVLTDHIRLNGVSSASPLVLSAIIHDRAGAVSMVPVLDGDGVVAIVRTGTKFDLTF